MKLHIQCGTRCRSALVEKAPLIEHLMEQQGVTVATIMDYAAVFPHDDILVYDLEIQLLNGASAFPSTRDVREGLKKLLPDFEFFVGNKDYVTEAENRAAWQIVS